MIRYILTERTSTDFDVKLNELHSLCLLLFVTTCYCNSFFAQSLSDYDCIQSNRYAIHKVSKCGNLILCFTALAHLEI